MPKLPDPTVLGGVRGGGGRAVARFDLTPAARGLEQLGQEENQGGQTFASAVGKAGQLAGAGDQAFGKGLENLGAGTLDYKVDQDRWQYSQASSNLLSNTIDLHQTYSKDQDYSTLSDRFTKDLDGKTQAAAAIIEDPAQRDRFLTAVKPQNEQAVAAIKNRADSLEGDANTAYVQQSGDKAIDQGAGITNPQLQQRIIQTQSDLIDGLAADGTITRVQAATMKQNWAHQFAIAEGIERSKTDPTGVINDLRAAPGSPEATVNRIIQSEGTGQNGASSANGTGQFTNQTWIDLIKQKRPDLAAGASDDQILAMRADKKLAYDMVGANMEDNRAYLKSKGVADTPGNLYLAHFLGPAGAAAVATANPNLPVSKVLADAVGPEKAAQMVMANPKVLAGQQAGSVQGWANGQMGGASAGGVHIYDILRPDQRALLLDHAETQLSKQQTDDQSGLKQRVDDSLAEASRTGIASKPVTLPEFVAARGAVEGPKIFQQYQGELGFQADKNKVATLDPEAQHALLSSYTPKAGADGYETQAAHYDQLAKAIKQTNAEKAADPAAFTISHMPASGQAYQTFNKLASDITASASDKQAAARDYATKVVMDQTRLGIPAGEAKIVPQGYVDNFNNAIATSSSSDDPKARTGLIGRVQAEAQTWGDAWPQVMRQLAPTAQPVVRAIAAGADQAAMTRLLNLDPKENPATLLKEQSETKSSDLRKALNTEMTPFLQTMVGRQKDRDFADYYNMSEKLAALYVRDGKDASTAAHDAFNALVGNRYDFRDTYRIPKSTDYSADDVQAGALIAKQQLEQLGAKPAIDDVGGLSDARGDSFAKFKRDGVWVTSPDNGGLNLMYGDKAVRREDGSPLFVSWGQLASIGGSAAARDAASAKAVSESGPVPLMGADDGGGAYSRVAANGGTGVYRGGAYDAFRRSDNVEDRRRESNVSRHQPSANEDSADSPDLSDTEKGALSKLLGIDDINSAATAEQQRYRQQKQEMYDQISRTIRKLRKAGSDLPLPQRGRPYLQGPDQ